MSAKFPTIKTDFSTLTALQFVSYILSYSAAAGAIFPALVARGRDFLETFVATMNEQVNIDPTVNRDAYLRCRAACTYAATKGTCDFTIQSRKGVWSVIDYVAPAASAPADASKGSGEGSVKADPIAVELAKAHARIAELETMLAARDATIATLNAKLADRKPASATRQRKTAALAA